MEVKNNEERAERVRERGKENLFCPKQPHEGVFILHKQLRRRAARTPLARSLGVSVCALALEFWLLLLLGSSFAPEYLIRRNYFASACVAMLGCAIRPPRRRRRWMQPDMQVSQIPPYTCVQNFILRERVRVRCKHLSQAAAAGPVTFAPFTLLIAPTCLVIHILKVFSSAHMHDLCGPAPFSRTQITPRARRRRRRQHTPAYLILRPDIYIPNKFKTLVRVRDDFVCWRCRQMPKQKATCARRSLSLLPVPWGRLLNINTQFEHARTPRRWDSLLSLMRAYISAGRGWCWDFARYWCYFIF